MGECFLYGNGGGSAVSGGTLVVLAPVGVRATVSSDEKGKTYTKTVGSDGKATFSGITTGDWKVTIASETQTASKVVTVVTDYTETLTFFSATINVSYPPGSTCTATHGVTTLPAPDTSGTWECVVPNAGTWTVTAVDGEKNSYMDVEITTDGQIENVTLAFSEYVIQDGVIDMDAHPCTVTENASASTKATNGVTYNDKPSLHMVARNGTSVTYSFANVTVPNWATLFIVEYYYIPAYTVNPAISIGGASVSVDRGSSNRVENGTASIDVSSMSGTTGDLKFKFTGSAYNDYCNIGNAWFE